VHVQCRGTGARGRQRSVCTAHVSAAANTEAGEVHAGAQVSARCHAQNDGQRRHVLRTSHTLHLHLQVSSPRHHLIIAALSEQEFNTLFLPFSTVLVIQTYDLY